MSIVADLGERNQLVWEAVGCRARLRLKADLEEERKKGGLGDVYYFQDDFLSINLQSIFSEASFSYVWQSQVCRRTEDGMTVRVICMPIHGIEFFMVNHARNCTRIDRRDLHFSKIRSKNCAFGL